MLDDILEAAVDILGDVLEAVVSSGRRKRKKSGCGTRASLQAAEPWERGSQPAPWEK